MTGTLVSDPLNSCSLLSCHFRVVLLVDIYLSQMEVLLPESGGPTTQSGILYQNSIAALYLGQLVDIRPVPLEHRIAAVRVEAPEFVDDIVVTFANGGRLLIQAKETLIAGSAPWKSFWKDALQQLTTSSSELDRFLLSVGNYNDDLNDLRELSDRSKGKENLSEWLDALSQRQTTLLEKIVLTAETEQAGLFQLMRRLSVQFLSFEQIETIGIRDRIPASSTAPETLFAVLRDLCGGAGRIRDTFTSRSLAETLSAKKQIKLAGASGDGLAGYLRAIEVRYSTISVPGTPLTGTTDELWVAPSLVAAQPSQGRDFEEEAHHRGFYWSSRASVGEPFDLSLFPSSGSSRILIEAGAGFGKSSIIAAIARQLATQGVYVPAVLSAQLIAGPTGLVDVLEQHVNHDYRTAIDWPTLLSQGRAALLIDGVDELSDESRATAIEHIRQAVAVFSEAPVVVATRDGASMPLMPLFSCFRIARFDRDQQTKVLKRYLNFRPEIRAQRIEHDLYRSDELSALCSIPLFLALLVATMPKSGELPKGRSELLERYLAVALAPQQHRPVSRPRLPLTKLRTGAEALALAGLRRHEIAIPETNARAELNAALGEGNGDHCVEDLIQCGLILRRGFRIGFAIATVQEYLAGCAVSQLFNHDLSEWFSNVARRPWAQALQFAIEKADGIEQALIAQLDTDDDVFHTSLLIVARSIASGAQVSASFRKTIVDRLLSIWTTSGSTVERQVGRLLLDGLASPPPPRLLDMLQSPPMTHMHPDLIAQTGDDKLVLNALASILRGSDIRGLWSRSWHEIIRPLSRYAVPILLDRARQADRLSAGVIASVIYELRGTSSIEWSIVTNDTSLPENVRVAALWGAGHENTLEGRQAIEALVVKGERSGWYDFSTAYCATRWWRDHFTKVVFGEPHTAGARALVFDTLISDLSADGTEGRSLVDHLAEILRKPPQGSIPLLPALLLAASFGDPTGEAESLERLRLIGSQDIFFLASYMPYLPEHLKLSIIRAVKLLVLEQPDEWNAIESFLRGSKYVPNGRRVLAPNGPFYVTRTKSRRPKPLPIG